MTLNELVQFALNMESKLLESGGEITPELDAELSTLHNNLTTKIDSYAHVLNSFKMRKELALNRLKEWEAVVAQCERTIDNINQVLDVNLSVLGKDRFDGMEYTITRQNNPASVEITNEAALPGKYLVTETKTKVSKREILEDLKNNVEVPGAQLKQSQRIVVKTSQRRLT
jgi:MinD-like ATPase involved in chromosome partitioning or flagellar assembly